MNQNQVYPQVGCHSEYQYAERPTTFSWGGEWLTVAEVITHWRSPQGMHFRVLTAAHGVFELSYFELEGIWEVQQP
jgi:hypothetical protein